jgi:hypothetical protein
LTQESNLLSYKLTWQRWRKVPPEIGPSLKLNLDQ